MACLQWQGLCENRRRKLANYEMRVLFLSLLWMLQQILLSLLKTRVRSTEKDILLYRAHTPIILPYLLTLSEPQNSSSHLSKPTIHYNYRAETESVTYLQQKCVRCVPITPGKSQIQTSKTPQAHSDLNTFRQNHRNRDTKPTKKHKWTTEGNRSRKIPRKKTPAEDRFLLQQRSDPDRNEERLPVARGSATEKRRQRMEARLN